MKKKGNKLSHVNTIQSNDIQVIKNNTSKIYYT